MNRQELRRRVRADAINEAKLDNEQEAKIERTLRKWKRATAIAGGALLASVVAVIPFLAGQPLYRLWDAVGKKILLLAMALFLAFVYTSGHTFAFWYYLRGLKRIHKKYAPPGSKYRTGKKG